MMPSKLVRVAGFEPAASCVRRKRSAATELHPERVRAGCVRRGRRQTFGAEPPLARPRHRCTPRRLSAGCGARGALFTLNPSPAGPRCERCDRCVPAFARARRGPALPNSPVAAPDSGAVREGARQTKSPEARCAIRALGASAAEASRFRHLRPDRAIANSACCCAGRCRRRTARPPAVAGVAIAAVRAGEPSRRVPPEHVQTGAHDKSHFIFVKRGGRCCLRATRASASAFAISPSSNASSLSLTPCGFRR